VPLRCGVGWSLSPGHGDTDQYNETCPACHRPLRFGDTDIYAGTVHMDCCGITCYENPEQYPAITPASPTSPSAFSTLMAPGLSTPYFELKDRIPHDQLWTPWSPTDGSPKHEISSPGIYPPKALEHHLRAGHPGPGLAYLATGDEKYAALLAALFDRLADLYPGWPLWLPYSGPPRICPQSGRQRHRHPRGI